MWFNVYRFLVFEFLCNFHYFSIEDFIFLILGVFKRLLIKIELYYNIVLIRICLRIFLLEKNMFS